MGESSPDDSEKDPGVPAVTSNPRLVQARSLRELAYTWYALSLACRRVGAMIEGAAKEILYEPVEMSQQDLTKQ